MTKITSVKLYAEHVAWIDRRDLNLSKYVRRCIDKEIDMERGTPNDA